MLGLIGGLVLAPIIFLLSFSYNLPRGDIVMAVVEAFVLVFAVTFLCASVARLIITKK